MLINIFKVAQLHSLFSNRVSVSIEKDENVVYPPNNPINNNERKDGPIPTQKK